MVSSLDKKRFNFFKGILFQSNNDRPTCFINYDFPRYMRVLTNTWVALKEPFYELHGHLKPRNSSSMFEVSVCISMLDAAYSVCSGVSADLLL